MIDYEKLAHAISEAEKSHNLPSASWRLTKADDTVWSESEGQRTRGVCTLGPSLRVEEKGVPTPQSGRRGNSFLSLSIVSNGWDDTHPHGGTGRPSALLSPAIPMLTSSRNT